jgi:riboflavin synthase
VFTGIIETMGRVIAIEPDQSNIHFTISASFCNELKIDQSIAHNGACLTVVELNDNTFKVTAVDETLKRTNLGQLRVGSSVNLERCMSATGRFEGHIVQGHVDCIGICTGIEDQNGSWKFHFMYNAEETDHITVQKGSVTINGTSLTVVDSDPESFSVVIIPYTMEQTLFGQMQVGDAVNLEFDIVGKYIARLLPKG